MLQTLTPVQWEQYHTEGYLRLGQTLTETELAALQQGIDDIMMGVAPLDYDRLMMQLDRIPGETDAPGQQSLGYKGATLRYRKIQNLEFDPLFLTYLQKPLFQHICAEIYGEETDVDCMRAMFMNKPAREGTRLVWHQDRWTNLDPDPLVTIWTALDPATLANGCVQIVPRAHHTLINPSDGSGFLTPEQEVALEKQYEPVALELAAGEAVLLHNYLPHSSSTNHTDIARRAFSVCYMDAATKASNGQTFSRVFGEGALEVEALSQGLKQH